MRVLRPVNEKIGNLRQYQVVQICADENGISLQFISTSPELRPFVLNIRDLADWLDHGLLRQALTAGIAWQPLGPYGRAAALRRGLADDPNLIELRLDYENSEGLCCRFQAVARSIHVTDEENA
jgi:hypothetical protein